MACMRRFWWSRLDVSGLRCNLDVKAIASMYIVVVMPLFSDSSAGSIGLEAWD